MRILIAGFVYRGNRETELSDPLKAKIPIAAMTANAFEEDRRDALAAGMNGHIAKPRCVPVLMESLADLLKTNGTAIR